MTASLICSLKTVIYASYATQERVPCHRGEVEAAHWRLLRIEWWEDRTAGLTDRGSVRGIQAHARGGRANRHHAVSHDKGSGSSAGASEAGTGMGQHKRALCIVGACMLSVKKFRCLVYGTDAECASMGKGYQRTRAIVQRLDEPLPQARVRKSPQTQIICYLQRQERQARRNALLSSNDVYDSSVCTCLQPPNSHVHAQNLQRVSY